MEKKKRKQEGEQGKEEGKEGSDGRSVKLSRKRRNESKTAENEEL